MSIVMFPLSFIPVDLLYLSCNRLLYDESLDEQRN